MSTTSMTKKQFRKYLIRRILVWAVIFLCIFLLATPIVWYTTQKSNAREALRDAKNVELALRLLSVQSYKLSEPLYDKTEESGLNDAYRDEVERYSGVDGGYVILAWNDADNRVEKFRYTVGRITIWYSYDFGEDQAEWSADYSLPLLNY